MAPWLLTGVFALLVFLGAWLSRFSRDESQWIYTTRYLSLFVHGQFSSPEWDTYWTHTQPPLARYVMGTSLRLAGFDLFRLNGPWDFSKEDSENLAAGNWPSDELLFFARLPISLAASLAVILIFLVGRSVGGPWAGAAAAGWLAFNPRLRELTTRAESEGLLVFLFLLTLLIGLAQIKLVEQRASAPLWKSYALAIAAGFLSALAASTKLSGAICLLGVLATIVIGFVFSRVKTRSDDGGKVRLTQAVLWSLLAAIAAICLFVALNPFLHSNPIINSVRLFQYRQDEMASQMQAYPSAAVDTLPQRVMLALDRPLFTYGLVTSNLATIDKQNGQVTGERLPIDALFVFLGVTFALTPRGAPARATRRNAVVLLAWTAISYAAIVANLGLDWDRYVLLLSVLAALWAGVGLAKSAEFLAARAGLLRRERGPA